MKIQKKHSLNLRGHQTSVSLEPQFWQAFKYTADQKQIGINALASEIDEGRVPQAGLASSIRLYVLTHYQKRAT